MLKPLSPAEPANVFEAGSRMGFAARGLVYLLIGFFALYGGQAESSSGVIEYVRDQSFGRILVGVLAVGLLGYGIWRFIGSWFDLEDEGGEVMGAIKRMAHAGSGLAYIGLAIFAALLAAGLVFGGSDSGSAERAAALALDIPGGRYLVMAAGLGFIFAGVVQGFKGVRGQHMENVVSSDAPKSLLKWLGRFGYVARGVVFAIIGYFIFQAGLAANPEATRTPGEALDTLIGWPAFALALGFLAFGVFSMLLARYRRINDEELRERLNNLA